MKTLCIIGSADNEDIPWDLRADYWIFNEYASLGVPKKIDGVFQMHVPEIYMDELNVNDPAHWEWLQKEHPFPIFMQEVDPLVPSSEKFPREEVKQDILTRLNVHAGDKIIKEFYTSSLGYAIALGIHKGYKKIHFYGIDLSQNTGYYRHLPCYMFWLGIAVGLGIELHIHDGTTHFNLPVYGYDGIHDMVSNDIAIARSKQYAKDIEPLDTQMRSVGFNLGSLLVKKDVDMVRILLEERAKLATQIGQLKGRKKISDLFTDIIIDRETAEAHLAKGLKELPATKIQSAFQGGQADVFFQAWLETKTLHSRKMFGEFHSRHMDILVRETTVEGAVMELRDYIDIIDGKHNGS